MGLTGEQREQLHGEGWLRLQQVLTEEIHLQARSGDVVVFSSHLWHAGALNRSGARRRVVIGQCSVPGLRMAGMETVQ